MQSGELAVSLFRLGDNRPADATRAATEMSLSGEDDEIPLLNDQGLYFEGGDEVSAVICLSGGQVFVANCVKNLNVLFSKAGEDYAYYVTHGNMMQIALGVTFHVWSRESHKVGITVHAEQPAKARSSDDPRDRSEADSAISSASGLVAGQGDESSSYAAALVMTALLVAVGILGLLVLAI